MLVQPCLAEKKISLGALVPSTGSAAEQGQWIRQGLELAATRVNAEGRYKIDLWFEDTQADPKTALAAYKRRQMQHKVPLVFSYGSGVGLALSPVTNLDQVVQIGLATSAPAYRSKGDFTFRNFPSAELEAAFLAQATLKQFGTVPGAIIKINNDYGIGTATSFRQAVAERGGKFSFEDELDPDETDFRTMILKLKQQKPEYIFLAAYPAEAALFLRQLRELGLTTPVIASVALLGSQDFFNLVGSAAEGVLVASSSPLDLIECRGRALNFCADFEKAYSKKPSMQHIFAARAYDALLVVAEVLKNCPEPEAICLRDGLYQVKNYLGSGGDISFDEYGDVGTPFSLFRIRHANFELVG